MTRASASAWIVVLELLFAASITRAQDSALLVGSPRCPGTTAPDVGLWIDNLMGSVARTLADAGLVARGPIRRSAEVLSALKQARGFHFSLYVGHGDVHDRESRLCFPTECQRSAGCPAVERIPIRRFLESLPVALSGAVMLVDACQSVFVDACAAPGPVSVISAARTQVDTDALFHEHIARALRWAADDPNCDGLVTDDELFQGLTALLYQSTDPSDYRATPRLRRQASSHIPLPIAPRMRAECRGTRASMEALLRKYGATLGLFGEALAQQLALKPLLAKRQDLPRTNGDYYVIAPDVDPIARDRLERVMSPYEPLQRLALRYEEATALGSFVIFAEIYSMHAQGDWIRIERLRDRSLFATRRIDELFASLPRRAYRGVPLLGGTPEETTYADIYYAEAPCGRPALPCDEEEGQCFWSHP